MWVTNPGRRYRPGIVRLAGGFQCAGGVGSLLRETLLLEILCGAASTPGQPRIPTSGIPIQSLLSGASVLVPATSLAFASIWNSVKGANKTDQVIAIIKLLLFLRSAINNRKHRVDGTVLMKVKLKEEEREGRRKRSPLYLRGFGRAT